MPRLTQAESRERTRKRLLKSAERLFVKRGYQATTIDDISESAGFSRGAFYYNFESKEDLFLALVDEHLARAAQLTRDAMDAATTAKAKGAALQDLLARLGEHAGAQGRLELELIPNLLRDPALRAKYAEYCRQHRGGLAKFISSQFAQIGKAPPRPASELAAAVHALALGILVLASVDRDLVPPALFPGFVEVVLAAGK